MNSSTAYFHSRRNRDSRPAKIRVLRSIIIEPMGQAARPSVVGETLVVTDAVLHQLAFDDAEFLDRIDLAAGDQPLIYF